MNDLASMQSTVVMDHPPPPLTLHARRSTLDAPPAPADGEFADLLEHYRALIRARSIPYPVAYQFVKELGHGRQGVVFLATRHGARACPTTNAIKLFDPGIYSSAAKYWTAMGRIAKQISLLQPMNKVN